MMKPMEKDYVKQLALYKATFKAGKPSKAKGKARRRKANK